MTEPEDELRDRQMSDQPATPSPATSEGATPDSDADADAAATLPGADTPPPMPPSVTLAPGQGMPIAAPDLSRMTEEPAASTDETSAGQATQHWGSSPSV